MTWQAFKNHMVYVYSLNKYVKIRILDRRLDYDMVRLKVAVPMCWERGQPIGIRKRRRPQESLAMMRIRFDML